MQSMIDLGIISYATGAVLIGILALVLLTGERGRARKTSTAWGWMSAS